MSTTIHAVFWTNLLLIECHNSKIKLNHDRVRMKYTLSTFFNLLSFKRSYLVFNNEEKRLTVTSISILEISFILFCLLYLCLSNFMIHFCDNSWTACKKMEVFWKWFRAAIILHDHISQFIYAIMTNVFKF